MLRFVPWNNVGTVTFTPDDDVVEIGSFSLVEGADTLWVRITNPVNDGPWPWSYGILSFRTSEGQPLGSVKAYNSRYGEVYRLGNGLPPSVRDGVLTFEPRGFNLAWIKAGYPWTLNFEQQSGLTIPEVPPAFGTRATLVTLSNTSNDTLDYGIVEGFARVTPIY